MYSTYGRGGDRGSAVFEYTDILSETDRAWLLCMDDGAEHWFPKSQCEIDEDGYTIEVPDWLWRKLGLG